MSSPIPDGNYKIVNVAYPSLDVELLLGNAFTTKMIWTLTNVGHNKITLLNAASNTFAQVVQEISGETVTGDENPTTWTLVPTKVDEYLITVGNHDELAWTLVDPNTVIVLKPTVKTNTSQNWTFQAV